MMFRLIKWAFYGMIGYAIYQSFWGDWFEEQDTRTGRRGRRGGRGERSGRGRQAAGHPGSSRQIEGKQEPVQEFGGAQHSQTVGRGVVS